MTLVEQLHSKTIALLDEICELRGAVTKYQEAKLHLQEIQHLVKEIVGVEVIHTDN